MRSGFLSLLALSALILAGCETTSDAPQISTTDYPRLSFVAPPPPVPEDVPEASNPRKEVWRDGYWKYEGNGHFTWIHGELMPRPAPWAVWKPDQWVQHEYGWGFEPGVWQ